MEGGGDRVDRETKRGEEEMESESGKEGRKGRDDGIVGVERAGHEILPVIPPSADSGVQSSADNRGGYVVDLGIVIFTIPKLCVHPPSTIVLFEGEGVILEACANERYRPSVARRGRIFRERDFQRDSFFEERMDDREKIFVSRRSCEIRKFERHLSRNFRVITH